jgi:hypothetical protein
MHYMQAHGYLAGPTQRPVLAGALTGLLAGGAGLLVFRLMHALTPFAKACGVNMEFAEGLFLIVFVVAGAVYGRIFQRTANDFRGGWLFGISFGFLIWMLGPLAVVQLWFGRVPHAGPARAGVLLASLVYGILLGGGYPWVHLAIQRRLRDVLTHTMREHHQKMYRCPQAGTDELKNKTVAHGTNTLKRAAGGTH